MYQHFLVWAIDRLLSLLDRTGAEFSFYTRFYHKDTFHR